MATTHRPSAESGARVRTNESPLSRPCVHIVLASGTAGPTRQHPRSSARSSDPGTRFARRTSVATATTPEAYRPTTTGAVKRARDGCAALPAARSRPQRGDAPHCALRVMHRTCKCSRPARRCDTTCAEHQTLAPQTRRRTDRAVHALLLAEPARDAGHVILREGDEVEAPAGREQILTTARHQQSCTGA